MASSSGLQNSAEDSTMKWYQELQDSAARCTQSFEQLNSPRDAQVSRDRRRSLSVDSVV